MSHRPGRTAGAAIALLITLVAGACSDDGGDAADTTGSTAADSSSTTATDDTTETTAGGSTTTTDAGTAGGPPCSRTSEGDEGTTVTAPGGGEATIGAEEIFADLPPEVPLPEDSILDTTSSAAADVTNKVWVIRCTTTTDDPEAAWNAYKSALDGTGCTIVDQTLQSAGGTFVAGGECERGDYTVRAGLTSAVGAGAPEGAYRWDIAVRQAT
jgi:hypothetical protein